MPSVAKPKLLIAVLAALLLGACGGEEPDPSPSPAPASGAPIDLAFAEQMAEHHEGAIEMAELAGTRARHSELEALAEDIVTSQQREVRVLQEASARLEQGGAEAGDLGVPAHMSGMDHDAAALKAARPFDRAFVDAMIPHHQGAIRMARVQLDRGGDAELKALAEDVVESQSREIESMNEWRSEWYGAPSPAGGVPAADEAVDEQATGSAEGHEGH